MLILAEKEAGEWRAAGEGRGERSLAMDEPVRPGAAASAGNTMPGRTHALRPSTGHHAAASWKLQAFPEVCTSVSWRTGRELGCPGKGQRQGEGMQEKAETTESDGHCGDQWPPGR